VIQITDLPSRLCEPARHVGHEGVSLAEDEPMKYLAYFGSSVLVVVALLGGGVLIDGEWLLGRDLVPADSQPVAKAMPKNCKRGAKGADQISPEALLRLL
jgi:hypothetical protein